ncbi:hypothetical protein KR222_005412, partial [Zaprionus bogoriensis]
MTCFQLFELPDECLLNVYRYLDLQSQCSFALTCRRAKYLYDAANSRRFRCFIWDSSLEQWKHAQIKALFRLSGHSMRMLSIFEAGQRAAPLSKAVLMASVCMHLTNLRSLMLIVDQQLDEMLLQVCKHLDKLEHLTVDSAQHANYEFLALLPRLRSLDIEHFTRRGDKLFQRFAELRPQGLQHLRVGSELTLQTGRHLPRLRSLTLLSIFRPHCLFVNCIVRRVSQLRVLSITNARRLHDNDFRNLIVHLKLLSSLYVSDCPRLGDDYVWFLVEHLAGEVQTLRSLPFYLKLTGTAVLPDIENVF